MPGLILALLLSLVSCSSLGRPTVPPGTIPVAKAPTISDEQYGHQVVQQLSEKYQIDSTNPALDRVQDIVERLTKAAKADQDPWHVYLFKDDKLKNAAATRGNHIFIWTGMLNTTKSDGELAAVLAHEIGHVLAGHTAEDPNEEVKRILIQVAGVAAGMAVSMATRYPQLGNNLGNLTSSVTTSVGEGLFIAPYAKGDEFEADQIGLELMAEAKYDPQEAINFWTRGLNDPDFSSSIPFLSTHPPAPDRLEKLRQIMPFAMARYKGQSLPTQTAQNSPQPDFSSYGSPGRTDQAPEKQPSGSDSFDLRGGGSFPSEAKGGEQLWADEWKVIAEKAVVYSEPDPMSQKLGEFRNGSIVKSLGRRAGWLRIGSPDRGFLQEKDLMPVYQKGNKKKH